MSFVQQQMADPVQRFESISDLKSKVLYFVGSDVVQIVAVFLRVKATKRSVIGYFGEEVSNEYLMFKTVGVAVCSLHLH